MSHTHPLLLQVHLAAAEPYELDDEMCQQSLANVIRAEAEIGKQIGPYDRYLRRGLRGASSPATVELSRERDLRLVALVLRPRSFVQDRANAIKDRQRQAENTSSTPY